MAKHMGQMSLLQDMLDPEFLKSGESPKSDSIPNEVLKRHPEGMHQAMHKMFILM